MINIDPLLDAFEVTFKASSLEKGYPALFEKLAKAEKPMDRYLVVMDIIKLTDDLRKVLTKVGEKIPLGGAPSIGDKKEVYTPNSTVCLSCGGQPHGLTDGITDDKGNVKDTIKTNITWRYNPKTKISEKSETKDTIPTKVN